MNKACGHVVAIAAPCNLFTCNRATVFFIGHNVSHKLAWVRAVGQAVYYRHFGIFSQLDKFFWIIGSYHYCIDITRKNPRGIGNGFTPAQLAVLAAEHNRIAAQLFHADLKRYPCPG